MRALILLAGLALGGLALAGCSKEELKTLSQHDPDRGIPLRSGLEPDPAAAPAEPREPKGRHSDKPAALPGGLGGDAEHRNYSSAPQTPPPPPPQL